MGTFHIKEPIELSYIHIPRSGMAMKKIISDWLRPQYSVNDEDEWMINHPNLKMVREHITTGKTLSVVRNPWQRVYSLYRKVSTEGYWLDWNGQTLLDLKPINEWIADYCNPEVQFDFPRWFTRFTNMVDFINDNGQTVDFVIKAESLETDFVLIQDYLNNYTPLPDLSGYDHVEYRKYLNTESIKGIERIYARDVEYFRYTP